MSRMFLFLTFAFISLNVQGQPSQSAVDHLISIINRDNRVEFETKKSTIEDAQRKMDDLNLRFDELEQRMRQSSAFVVLTSVSNPTANTFGKSFVEIVNEKIKTNFTFSQQEKPEQSRFSSTIDNLMKNPVVNGLMSSNPYTSIAGSVISAASQFFSSKSKLNGEVISKNKFSLDQIQKFSNELQPYITFYQSLLDNANRYLLLVDNLKKKSASLKERLSKCKRDLSKMSDKTFATSTDEIGIINYKNVMSSNDFQDLFAATERYATLKVQVNLFKDEYNAIVFDYLTQSLDVLNKAKTSSSELTNIDDAISKIKEALHEGSENSKNLFRFNAFE